MNLHCFKEKRAHLVMFCLNVDEDLLQDQEGFNTHIMVFGILVTASPLRISIKKIFSKDQYFQNCH